MRHIHTCLLTHCPNCGGDLDSALVQLNDEMLVCVSDCGWEEGDEDPSDYDDRVIHHICGIPSCLNPDHLDIVSRKLERDPT